MLRRDSEAPAMTESTQSPSVDRIGLEKAVELRNIEPIPREDRHGNPRQQFTLWFSAQLYLASIVLGAVGVSIGLGLWPTLWALIAANALGAVFNSTCVIMGPRLGIAQLPMSRASFGYYGNFLPAILATLEFIGYFSVGTILGAHVVQQIWHVPYWSMVIVIGAACIFIAVVGHDFVHRWGYLVSAASFVVLAALTGLAFSHGYGHAAAGTLTGSNFWKAWFLQFTIAFSFTFSWGAYASDYSRYLPRETSSKKTFLWSYLGLAIGTIWMMFLGALLSAMAIQGGILPAMGVVSEGGFRYAVYVVLLAATVMANVLNLYSGGMASLTWDFPLPRWITVALVGIVGIVLSLAFGGSQFTHYYDEILYFVAYFTSPWMAVIFLHFFYFKRGWRSSTIPLSEFYRKNGTFGFVSWPAIIAFFVGFGVSVPFMATILYTGPIGNSLGGTDLSYFVSFIVCGILYFVLERQAIANRRTSTLPSEGAALR